MARSLLLAVALTCAVGVALGNNNGYNPTTQINQLLSYLQTNNAELLKLINLPATAALKNQIVSILSVVNGGRCLTILAPSNAAILAVPSACVSANLTNTLANHIIPEYAKRGDLKGYGLPWQRRTLGSNQVALIARNSNTTYSWKLNTNTANTALATAPEGIVFMRVVVHQINKVLCT